ncbi:Flp pilus assembly protein CpaB [Oceanobacillus damuensis]|uniref:Flp pilus assembly protein CpaB n=1 Tax=Oceanobacillus damuensis TaxID=937928 RepID=UPI00082EA1FC|nr:SAF domain-containing protein [Oceanobacillus damuensis]
MLESKRKALIFFLIAILLAAASGFLVLQKVQDLNSNLGTMVNIYVANGNIGSRQVITPDDLTTDEIPNKYLREEHVTNVEELINKVSTVPLSEGDIITKNMLKDASAVTDVDNRLISLLQSDKVFFDEELTALDRVDILVSHNLEKEPITEVFLDDVKVARVAADSDKQFSGVQVEVPYEVVPELIHMQNYADSMRIVKANVGQLAVPEESGNEAEAATEETDDKEAKATPEETTEKKEESESTKEKQAAETEEAKAEEEKPESKEPENTKKEEQNTDE